MRDGQELWGSENKLNTSKNDFERGKVRRVGEAGFRALMQLVHAVSSFKYVPSVE